MRTLVLLGLVLGLMATTTLRAQQYTRGVGVYPGDPKEDFAPVLVPDTQTYRNLALHRPAYHSSSYDYNLTAQLVTDGIKDTKMPRWVSVSTSENGTLKKPEREHLLDQNPFTSVDMRAARVWVQIELGGGDTPLEVDHLGVSAFVQSSILQPEGWTCVVLGSPDGQAWTELGRAAGTLGPPGDWKTSIAFASSSHSRFYRVQLEAPSVTRWNVSEVALFDKNERVVAGGPYYFTSAWKSAGSGAEWVYVDLGAECTFDRVVLHWIRRAAEGSIQVSDDSKDWRTLRVLSASSEPTEDLQFDRVSHQWIAHAADGSIHVSDDARNWRTLQVLPAASPSTDDLKLAHPARGRFVRMLMTRSASSEGYILSELEVYGRGGPVPRPKPALAAQAGGRQELAGGAWRVQRDSLVAADGRTISRPAFKDQDWLVATVPGTVLSSYWNAGALPDPNYGDNQLMISDSFFYADFWYRNEFVAPPAAPGRHVWLNFNGINWKAEVFLNGEMLGRIDGGFMRGRFDVTRLLRKGGRNVLAVLIKKNDTPGSMKEKTFDSPDKNGGALGLDNPTYHASVGWDWIPTIRGRDCGIWSDVYLTTSGPVTIDNPFVSTALPLPDVSRADVSVEVSLRNNDSKAVTGTLCGRFGEVAFEKQVTVDAASATTVKFDPSTTPALRLQQPKLWWPAGYGDPNLYEVKLSFETARKTSDTKSFQVGVRQFTYSDEGGALRIWINGRRLIPRGGNWGFPESMLRYRAREYDIAARYHAEMNFTMIRNWVGQTGDDEFYEACDRHGIVVWQDFWLANPFDGPDPADNELFLRNASDFILRVRNHPSLGLYCGRNEGNPPKPLDDGLRSLLATLHPGLHYISHSAAGVVSGGGPYRVMPQKFYFAQRATPKLHSELGMPNIVTLDSLKQMMPEADIWPQGSVWGLHDFTANGAQGGVAFRDVIEKSYGGADNAADWVTLAQFVNYSGYRAMFEAQSKNRMGVLLWMSHPAWPSFVWQTYDYYFEPTAAYFGSKKASEPLHIQWNPVSDAVEVVNYSGGKATGLMARAEILNMDGSMQWEKTATVDSAEDSVVAPIVIEYPSGLTPVHFIRLKLTRSGEAVSENFYWRGLEEGNYKAIRQLPKVKLEAATRIERLGSRWVLTTGLNNTSSRPALMVRVKAVREKSGDRILPAIYSDNYVALMPGERRVIRTDLENADTRGERPRMVIEGFNIGEVAGK